METTLARLLAAVGEPLLEVAAAPGGLDVPLTGLAIVDPDDEPDRYPGQLVLVIGARGGDATRALRAVARGGAAAVAVKGGGPDLAATALEQGVALLAVRPDVRWERLESLVRDVLENADADGPGDLFSLAQTTATLTRGIVSIEDTASRVLAYSRTEDDSQVDELRRLTILGWHGPPGYLRRLREWGVYDQLRAREGVVAVDAHPELGIRARLVAGIHAGGRMHGTIWVQEGAEPFAERASDVLLGAARVAAAHLVRRRGRAQEARWVRELVAGLLDGRASPDLVAGSFGLDEHAGAVVAAFAVRGPAEGLSLAELADVVAVHAATYRRAALTAPLGARVYAVLPDVPRDRIEQALLGMCRVVTATTARRTGAKVQVGIGSVAAGLARVPGSRTEADRVLDAMGAGHDDVAQFGDLRAEVLLNQTLGLLRASPELRDPAVDTLVRYDREHGTELVTSVLAWLDALGDVRAAAQRLTVHPNTLRYRVRRAVAIAGLQLDDPRARLLHHLELLLARDPTPHG